jgi:hypothetical protein
VDVVACRAESDPSIILYGSMTKDGKVYLLDQALEN